MMPTVLSSVAPEVVMPTRGATSDEKVGIMNYDNTSLSEQVTEVIIIRFEDTGVFRHISLFIYRLVLRFFTMDVFTWLK